MSKTALITGASRGIGAAIAVRLGEDGYGIWLAYNKNDNAAEQTKQLIESTGAECRLLKFDVSDSEESMAVLDAAVEKYGVPDVVINNAGITQDNILSFMTPEEWHSVIDTTLTGFYNITRVVLPGMIRKKSGRIINISSTSGETGLPGQVNYSAAKAGLIGATKALAKEVARRGILVNAVTPGFILTDMTSALPVEEIKKEIPLNRVGTPKDVAGVVSFLCSEDSSYITGQVISVNGGLYI